MPYGSATAVGSSASGWMVGFRENGSFATAQWNFVSDWVMLAVAN